MPAGWGEGAGGGGDVGPPRASTGERLQLRSPLIQLVLTPGAHSWGRAGRGPVGGHGVSEKAHSVLRASRTPVAMATWPSPSEGPPELRFPPASTRAWGWGLRKGAAGSGCRPCLSRPSSPGSGGPETSVLSSLPGLRGEPRPPPLFTDPSRLPTHASLSSFQLLCGLSPFSFALEDEGQKRS